MTPNSDAVRVEGLERLLQRGVGRRPVPGRADQRKVAAPDVEMRVDERRFLLHERLIHQDERRSNRIALHDHQSSLMSYLTTIGRHFSTSSLTSFSKASGVPVRGVMPAAASFSLMAALDRTSVASAFI